MNQMGWAGGQPHPTGNVGSPSHEPYAGDTGDVGSPSYEPDSQSTRYEGSPEPHARIDVDAILALYPRVTTSDIIDALNIARVLPATGVKPKEVRDVWELYMGERESGKKRKRDDDDDGCDARRQRVD